MSSFVISMVCIPPQSIYTPPCNNVVGTMEMSTLFKENRVWHVAILTILFAAKSINIDSMLLSVVPYMFSRNYLVFVSSFLIDYLFEGEMQN